MMLSAPTMGSIAEAPLLDRALEIARDRHASVHERVSHLHLAERARARVAARALDEHHLDAHRWIVRRVVELGHAHCVQARPGLDRCVEVELEAGVEVEEEGHEAHDHLVVDAVEPRRRRSIRVSIATVARGRIARRDLPIEVEPHHAPSLIGPALELEVRDEERGRACELAGLVGVGPDVGVRRDRRNALARAPEARSAEPHPREAGPSEAGHRRLPSAHRTSESPVDHGRSRRQKSQRAGPLNNNRGPGR
jgi:hypothetical protein